MSRQQEESIGDSIRTANHSLRLILGIIIGANGLSKSENPLVQAMSALVFISCLYLYCKDRQQEIEGSYIHADKKSSTSGYGPINDDNDDEKPSP
ncbi:MAG TPA: hypothetical protein VHE99_04490 [Gammaproteobacteria bacterium]|nr:hypothetical protein [Gammaproteobacteria bacterium]